MDEKPAPDSDKFDSPITDADWKPQTADDLKHALGEALRRGLTQVAFEFAVRGCTEFPAVDYFQKMARVLAPAVPQQTKSRRGFVGAVRRFVRRPASRSRGFSASRKWAADHAESYRGQWVAVAKGEFLAAGPTMADVRQSIADHPQHADALLIWIPPNADAG